MFDFHDATFWMMTAASLFNAALMATLGLTTLLTAPRRSLGATLAALGLLLGAAFFAAHAALLDYDLRALILGVRTWWFFGWAALIALPGAWYALMLWYTGFWDDATSRLHRAHGCYFVGALLTALVLTFFVAVIDPMRLLLRAAQAMAGNESPVEYSHIGVGGIGVALFAIYSVYAVSCLGLALDSVRRPAKSARLMGDFARRRARPWLLATTILLLLVSSLFGSGLLWLMFHAARGDLANFGENSVGGVMWSLDWFDALVCVLVGASTVTLGKALVSYDIFATGALPRNGLWRQWRRVVAVAALSAALLATALTFDLRPVYMALLATLSLSGAFALLQWRATVEREDTLAQLQMLFRNSDENIRRGDNFESDEETGTVATFVTLCRDILNAHSAHLIPLNTLAPLAGETLHFPSGAKPDARVLASVSAQQFPSADLCFSLSQQTETSPEEIAFSDSESALRWAVPLWNARGAIGVLLLGEKIGGALYTQEEIEMARTVCERLLDLRAGAGLSRRLMELQRRRLSESFVMDNRARRVLHDDILPQLHAAMLAFGTAQNDASTRAQKNLPDSMQLLSQAHRQISDLLRAMPPLSSPQLELGFCGALRHVAQRELSNAFADVDWKLEENACASLDALSELRREVVFYAAREAMRNAARHARKAPQDSLLLKIAISQSQSEIAIRIEDDGCGLSVTSQDNALPREYSRDENAAHENENTPRGGHGLALHSTLMAVIDGTLSLENVSPHGTRVVLTVSAND